MIIISGLLCDCETDGSFYSTTLRRYSTLLPLSAAVKEQNWKQKSPRNDCLVSMNGPGLQVAVIETSVPSQQSVLYPQLR